MRYDINSENISMNIFEKLLCKVVTRPITKLVELDDKIEKRTGFSPTNKLIEMDETDEQLRHENPAAWTAKKIAQGTIKGILGASFTKD